MQNFEHNILLSYDMYSLWNSKFIRRIDETQEFLAQIK